MCGNCQEPQRRSKREGRLDTNSRGVRQQSARRLEAADASPDHFRSTAIVSALPATGQDATSGPRLVEANAATEGRVALLTYDSEFADGIPEADRSLAEAALRLPGCALPVGPWAGPAAHADGDAFYGMVVITGLLSRTVTLKDRSSLELYGPGELISRDDIGDLGEEQISWDVHQPATLAVLDGRFALAARRWPTLWQVLYRRTAARAQCLAAHLAALQLSRVEDRIEAVLGQLSTRWGRVTSEGVLLPLPLTHAMLGRLVAARRSTVTLALAALAEQGKVTRYPSGWLLRPGEDR